MLKVLDLFSGIGGFSLGLERTGGFETVAFCEMDAFCTKILNKHWTNVPIFNDVRTITDEFKGSVDLICGGFPCQPFSVAGNKKGKEDDRYLWPAMLNCIKVYRPSWVIGENVTGIIKMALDEAISSLEAEGYSVRTFVIPACATNAPHKRDRVWIVAYSYSEGKQSNFEHVIKSCEKKQGKLGRGCRKEHIFPHSTSQRSQGQGQSEQSLYSKTNRKREANNAFCFGINNQWAVEPDVGRVAHGVPDRVDRLKSLGNAVVPQVVAQIGHAILTAEAL